MTEQQRHLQVVKGVAALGACAVVVVAWLLYYGQELPPYEMRVQHTDATGYAPPPGGAAVQTGAVPRTVGLEQGRTPLSPAGTGPIRAGGGVPPQAAALANPLAGNSKAAARGKRAYDVNCAMCHGGRGRGDGAVGVSYVPKPTDLTGGRVAGLSDGALFTSITDGIVSTPFPTARDTLPSDWHAYRAITTVQERWQMVAYMRQLEAQRATPR